MSKDLSILIVRLSAIGDVVMTTAAVRALKSKLPQVRTSWVVEPRSASILEGNPDIDNIIVWDERGVGPFLKLTRTLRREKFDVAIDFQGLARSALVTMASGATRRIGYRNGREFSKLAYNELTSCKDAPKTRRCHHGIRCYLSLLKPLGIEIDPEDDQMRVVVSPEESADAGEMLAQAGLGQGERFLAFCSATTRANKHWTEAGWAKLVDLTSQKTGLKAVFLGAKADYASIDRILAQAQVPAINLAGKTTLKQSAAVIDRSDAVVAVDTGLMHISVALGKTTVALFGPTTAWKNHIHRDNFTMISKNMECSPCRKKPTCENFDCMTSITADEVMEVLQAKLTQCAEGVEGCRAI